VDTADFKAVVAARIAQVEQRVSEACRRAGRARSEVTVVCVTKQLSPEATVLLPDLGIIHFGENRPQELWKKAALLAGRSIVWHLIGHLQRNKIERTLPLVELIHSVDSLRLLEAIDQEAGRRDLTAPVLLEVNASGEASKHGFQPGDMTDLAAPLERLKNVEVRGLMTMAAPLANPEECRPTFATLRELRDSLKERLAPLHPCDELSMGMTNDFEVAIGEGATFVRLGSIFFEGFEG
jgi:pyridoxal phosphate enzyme (YggS family)